MSVEDLESLEETFDIMDSAELLGEADLDEGSLVYSRTRVAPRTDDAPPAREQLAR